MTQSYSDSNWWENFFHGVALDFWRAAVTAEQTRAEADFIQQQLQLAGPAKILDVPCGNGRLSLELAARGFELTGVDIASEFIQEAKTQSAERDLPIEFFNRDMRELPWQAEFDAAFCFGNSFGYLDDRGNADFLQALSGALKPGARMVLETGAAAECVLPTFQERRWFEIGGITFLVHNRYDHEQGRLFTEYTFIRDGKIERRPGSQRVYTYSEIVRLGSDAGLAVIASFGSIASEPFRLGSPRLLLVAEKAAS
jgi:SAM-dependent methyltransferase